MILEDALKDIETEGWYERICDGETKLRYTKGNIEYFMQVEVSRENYQVVATVHRKFNNELIYYNKYKPKHIDEALRIVDYQLKFCEAKSKGSV